MSTLNVYNNGIKIHSQTIDLAPDDTLDVDTHGTFFVTDASTPCELTALKKERDWWKKQAISLSESRMTKLSDLARSNNYDMRWPQ